MSKAECLADDPSLYVPGEVDRHIERKMRGTTKKPSAFLNFSVGNPSESCLRASQE
ncbi:MAG TPA: hypothetical protein VJB12_06260 [Candidatus Nanoarchaeia archaeon]|nr:hypothetical protein [Candidatus Nanoarchaeia archaeon]